MAAERPVSVTSNKDFVDFSRDHRDLNYKLARKDRRVGVDVLVRNYLLSRGYNQATAELEKEYQKKMFVSYFLLI